MYDWHKYKGHLPSALTNQLCQVYRTITMTEESNEKQNAYLAVHIPQVQRQCAMTVVYLRLPLRYMQHLASIDI